jgi:hypothetical protein
VDAGQHRAGLAALRGARRSDVLARKELHQRGRLAVELAQESAAAVGHRARGRHAVAGEVILQVEIEGQLVRPELLEQRQDVAPFRGGDEVVGVLDAGGHPLELAEGADGVVLEPGAELFAGDGRENGHFLAASGQPSAVS